VVLGEAIALDLTIPVWIGIVLLLVGVAWWLFRR
jgi:LPXTG-motif cell wall-anchored protein